MKKRFFVLVSCLSFFLTCFPFLHLAENTQSMESMYAYGIAYMGAEDYEKAIDAFSQAIGYKDANEKLIEAKTFFLDEIIANTQTCLDTQQYEFALYILQHAEEIIGNDARIEIQRISINAALKKALLDAIDTAIAKGSYREAADCITIAEDYLGLENIDILLRKAQITSNARDEFLSTADTYMNTREYISALFTIQQAIDSLGEDPLLLSKMIEISGLRDSAIEEEITKLTQDGDIMGAFQHLQYLSRFMPENEKIQSLYTQLLENEKPILIQQAEVIYQSNGYISAIEFLCEWLEFAPKDPDLLNSLNYYRGKVPVWLTSLDYFTQNGGMYKYDNQYTNLGEQVGYVLMPLTGVNTDITYIINEKYSRLTGIFSISYGKRDSRFLEESFSIYTDGLLIYTSPTLVRGSLPITFDIDVSGCDMLKIKTHSSGTLTSFLGNVQLHP